MSVSINNYYNKKYYYDNNGGTSTASTQSSVTNKSKNVSGTDSIDFSQVALQYFNSNKTHDSSADYSTDTYAPVKQNSAPPLTTDRMKSLLSDIDLSTANEHEISSLFQNIQSIPFSLAYADGPSSSEPKE